MNLCLEYGEDECEDEEPPGDMKAKARVSGAVSEPGTLKRFADRSHQDLVLYKMAAVLASVGAGFDIRISNTSAIHPQVPGAMTNQVIPPVLRKEAFIGQRRDAYCSAIRDSFIEPENMFNGDEMDSCSHSAIINNTFHGITTHYRASIDFEMPSRLKKLEHDVRRADSVGSMTPSSDDNFGATTSISGPSSPYRSSIDDLQCEATNVSSSLSLESASGECNTNISCQPTANQQNMSENLISHCRCTDGSIELSSRENLNDARCLANDFVCPVTFPGVVDDKQHKLSRSSKIPVRPDTLNVVPVAGQTNGVNLKSFTSHAPSHRVLHTSSNSSLVFVGNGLGGYPGNSIPSLRSVTSPGSTPPHIDHPRTLLDIDMDGQS